MSWYKISKTKNLNADLKNIIKTNPFFVKLLDIHSIPIEWIDDKLTFHIKDLKRKKAQSDSKSIIFDSKLFEEDDFYRNGLHYLAHELYHWISRQKENNFYFADPEEMDAFATGMAYEIISGKDLKTISKLYYPIIEDHFDKEKQAKKLFVALYRLAQERVKDFG